MNKPNNYEATQVGSDFTPVELGGHKAIIKKVEETTSSTGKPMLKIAIDFDTTDKQPNYFMESFKNDIRPDKKWPANGVIYVLSEDANGNCSKNFKSFINAFEKSNGCTAIWGAKFANQFTNKKIGTIFGLVEEEYNGEVKKRHKHRWFCEYDKAESASIPEAKLLATTSEPLPASTNPADGFVNVPDGVDADVPF